MLIGEPPPTQGDLRFSLLGVPVRVHPFFWLVAVILGLRIKEPVDIIIWVAVVFVSILVHEFGHALAIRRFGWQPWITLYGMGGLASHNRGHSFQRDRPSVQIIISLAGPAAGFILAAVVVALLYLAGHEQPFFFGITLGQGEPITNPRVAILVWFLLQVNIFWGLINLFPVYPLDGGQVAREVFTIFHPSEGIRLSLILSTVTGVVLAVVGILYLEQLFMALLFGYLAYSSYATLKAYTGGGFGGGRPW